MENRSTAIKETIMMQRKDRSCSGLDEEALAIFYSRNRFLYIDHEYYLGFWWVS
jgi:hypothetical protein